MGDKAKIEVWQRADDSDDCFNRYLLAGTYESAPFICKVGWETDGRDAEYVHIAGVSCDFGGSAEEYDRWDELLRAVDAHPGLRADMTPA